VEGLSERAAAYIRAHNGMDAVWEALASDFS